MAKERKRRNQSRETFRALILAILLALGIRAFVVEPFKIPSGSMIPTLLVGDHIFVNKYSYGVRLPVNGVLVAPLGEPSRGDVMVFRYPDDPGQDFIKRCVGVPGDRIEIRDGRLLLNGQLVDRVDRGEFAYPDYERGREVRVRCYDETLDEGVVYPTLYDARRSHAGRRGPWEVPPGHYFMLGDNRDSSRDSRFWRQPFVRADQIKGRAMFVYWSWVVARGQQKERGIIGDLLFTLYRVVTLQIEDVRWGRMGRGVHAHPCPLPEGARLTEPPAVR
jgi:signal peptidase I